MRITYRDKNNHDYWTKRWTDIEADTAMLNDQKYPLKYSKLLIKDKNKLILEVGCGAGRVLRYYHDNGFKIIGIDFVKEAVEKLKKKDPTLRVEFGDIKNLKFDNNYFDYILAFGLYHNLENTLEKSILETKRVLKSGGYVCASFRADNIQTKIVDFLHSRKINKKQFFHKLNFTKKEFEKIFISNGFIVEKIFPVENMPFLYKFSIFRSKKQKVFNENIARIEGYQLSSIGKILQKILINLLPDHFCNVYLLIAKKV